MKDNELQIGHLTPEDWTLSEKEVLNFQSLYILYLITEGMVQFPNFLVGRLRYIQKAIDFLEDMRFIVQKEEFDEKKVLGFTYAKSDISYIYEASDEGKQVVKSYRNRYREYIRLYDVYAFVDPQAGKFAMSKYKKHMLKGAGKSDWLDYLNDDRWQDYRIPVTVYKGLDPREFMFFSFIEGGRFMPKEDDDEHEWVEDLFLGKIWDEMYLILESAPRWEDQGFDEFKPEDILETIIHEGAEVIKSQRKKLNSFIKKQEIIISEIEGLEALYLQEEKDEEYYFDDPVNYHGMHEYTPLRDPMFWITAAIVI